MIDIFGAENSVFSSDMRIWSWNQSLARRVSAAHAIDVLRDIFARGLHERAGYARRDGRRRRPRALAHSLQLRCWRYPSPEGRGLPRALVAREQKVVDV